MKGLHGHSMSYMQQLLYADTKNQVYANSTIKSWMGISKTLMSASMGDF